MCQVYRRLPAGGSNSVPPYGGRGVDTTPISLFTAGSKIMLRKELLDILACPKCKGDLEYDKDNDVLICNACRLKYMVKDDIPVMLIDEAESF